MGAVVDSPTVNSYVVGVSVVEGDEPPETPAAPEPEPEPEPEEVPAPAEPVEPEGDDTA